jgi:hypothetical protein
VRLSPAAETTARRGVGRPRLARRYPRDDRDRVFGDDDERHDLATQLVRLASETANV